jgi:hypothetical protein
VTFGPAFFNASPITRLVTLNPSDKHADISLSAGTSAPFPLNMVATKGNGEASRSVRATLGRAHTDNGYFEVYVAQGQTSTFMLIGLATSSLALTTFCGADANSWGYYQDTGQKFTNNVGAAMGATWKTNADVVQVVLNNGKIWFGKNNVYSGNPAAGTGEAYSGLTGTLFPTLSLYRGSAPSHQLGFRAHTTDLTYAPPAGIGPWDR